MMRRFLEVVQQLLYQLTPDFHLIVQGRVYCKLILVSEEIFSAYCLHVDVVHTVVILIGKNKIYTS
jgi:hypothetical protein